MRSGFVAVVGRANAGKSTLVNALVGEKISIVSPKPQTTRDRITGIFNGEDVQIAFVDTPGLYKMDNRLNDYMQRAATTVSDDVDLILYVLDAHKGISDADRTLVKKWTSLGVPAVIGLSKTDIMPENLLISEIKELSEFCSDIVPFSARKNKNLKELVNVLSSRLPEGDRLFGDDVISDRSARFMVGEIMREKLLCRFDEEIPYGIAIIVNEFNLRPDGKVYDVSLDVICEKQEHKAILIGKGGGAIKEAGRLARYEMEKFLGKKVFLTTYVKVEENWRNDASLVKRFGYDLKSF